MKRIITLTIMLGFFTFKGLTQTYFQFPDSTAIWNIEKTNNFYGNGEIRYGQLGDTIINTITYKKILTLIDTTLYHPQTEYLCGLREEDKRIFVKLNGVDEQLLYDFNLNVGDSIKYNFSGWFPWIQPDTFYRKVISIDTVVIYDGTSRRHYSLENTGQYNYMNDEWIEGIGSNVWLGLFNPFVVDILLNGDGFKPICVKVNDSLVFLGNSLCGECFCRLYTQIIDIHTMREVVLPYPNPTNDNIVFKFPDCNNSNITLKLFDLNGNLLIEKQKIEASEIFLNVDWIKQGTYVYEMIVDGKVINTGKIVKK